MHQMSCRELDAWIREIDEPLRAFATKICRGTRIDADEIAQRAELALFELQQTGLLWIDDHGKRYIYRYEKHEPLKNGYAYTIVLNTLKNMARTYRRHANHVGRRAKQEPRVSFTESIDELVLEEQLNALNKCLEALPTTDRDLFIGYKTSVLNRKQFAELKGIGFELLKRQLALIRKRLEDCMLSKLK